MTSLISFAIVASWLTLCFSHPMPSITERKSMVVFIGFLSTVPQSTFMNGVTTCSTKATAIFFARLNYQSCLSMHAESAKCELPPEVGLCMGYFPRWYFNIQSGSCEQFIYGGCMGNENNFGTRRECERECSSSKCMLAAFKISMDIVGACVPLDFYSIAFWN